MQRPVERCLCWASKTQMNFLLVFRMVRCSPEWYLCPAVLFLPPSLRSFARSGLYRKRYSWSRVFLWGKTSIILNQSSGITHRGLSWSFASICPKCKAGDRKQCSGLWTASNPSTVQLPLLPTDFDWLLLQLGKFPDCSQGKLRF